MAIACLALPAAASAEYLVPPGNSAATQYTEALPTAGGHSDAEKPNKKQSRTPQQVLGARDAQQLEEQGAAGREAAEFAAETAPGGGVASRPGEKGSDKSGGGLEEEGDGTDAEGGTVGAGNDGGGGSSGSSGLGEVVAQATGSSSGQLGLLLPLAIAGAAAWALAFALRQRSRPTP